MSSAPDKSLSIELARYARDIMGLNVKEAVFALTTAAAMVAAEDANLAVHKAATSIAVNFAISYCYGPLHREPTSS